MKAQEKYDRLKALDLDNVEVAARDLDISRDAEVVNIRRTIDGLNADYANKIAAGLGPSNSQVKAIQSQITQERKLIKEAIQNIVAHANSDLQDKRREVEHWRTNLDGKHEIATAMTNAQAASSKIAITVKVRDTAPVSVSIEPETVVAPFVSVDTDAAIGIDAGCIDQSEDYRVSNGDVIHIEILAPDPGDISAGELHCWHRWRRRSDCPMLGRSSCSADISRDQRSDCESAAGSRLDGRPGCVGDGS